MLVPTIPTMDVSEIDDIPFGPWELSEGETIISVTVTIVRAGGEPDPNPSTMLIGQPQIGRLDRMTWIEDPAGSYAVQRIKAGVANTTYGVKAVASTSSGRILAAPALLPVKDLASTLDSCG